MNQPIVIDNGSGILKAGFAGADKPRVVFRSYVGRTKHMRMMAGGALDGSEVHIGAKAEAHRGALMLSYPMNHGIVENWGDMEKIWSHIYDKENLNVSSEEHAVLHSACLPSTARFRPSSVYMLRDALRALCWTLAMESPMQYPYTRDSHFHTR